jgi:hypothetical protein
MMYCHFRSVDNLHHVCTVCGKPLTTRFTQSQAKMARARLCGSKHAVQPVSKGPGDYLHEPINAAVMAEVCRRWHDDPAIRTKEEITEIIRRYPPRCGRPEQVKKYADYALVRHAWMVPDWGKDPDPKLWTDAASLLDPEDGEPQDH